MAGFDNDVMYAKNADFTQADNQAPAEANGLATNAQLWIGSTALNSGGTHINVGTLTSPDNSINFSYASPNISAVVAGGSTVGKTITGNTGGALSPTLGNWNIVTANTTVRFVGSGSTLTQNFGSVPNSNLLLGASAPSVTSGAANLGLGINSLNAITSGSGNVVLGTGNAQALTTGGSNVIVGPNIVNSLVSGSNNVVLGMHSTTLTGSDSSNLYLGGSGGSESNTIRIGEQGTGSGQQNQAFCAGITGVTAAGSPVAVSSTGQLSDLGFGTATQVLTSNGAGVSPTWQAAGGGGSSSYFQAYLTSNQTVAGGSTSDTIIFDTAISNVGSDYDTTTGIFTAPATGFYGFACTVNFGNLTTPVGLTQVILGYTGSVQSLRVEQFGLVPATTGAALICTASWAMPMTAGDTVKMQPFADGAGDYVIIGGALGAGAFNTASTFSGWRIA